MNDPETFSAAVGQCWEVKVSSNPNYDLFFRPRAAPHPPEGGGGGGSAQQLASTPRTPPLIDLHLMRGSFQGSMGEGAALLLPTAFFLATGGWTSPPPAKH